MELEQNLNHNSKYISGSGKNACKILGYKGVLSDIYDH